jgi:hypothetical protein
MYQLAQPRYEGPLRRRWRNRTTFRGLSLSEVWRWRVGRSGDAVSENLPGMVEGAVLRQDMEWLLLADQDIQPLVRVVGPGG